MLLEGLYRTLAGVAQVIGLRADAAGNLGVTPPSALTLAETMGAIAASAVYTSAVLDLGEKFSGGLILAEKVGVASAGEILRIDYSHDQSTWLLCPMATSGFSAAYNTTSGVTMTNQARPMARYVRAQFANGATIQSAGSVLHLTFLPGI